MKQCVHTCEVRGGDGHRLRIVAVRSNCRELLADFDIQLIQQRAGHPPKVIAEAELKDYSRGLGVDGLFALILSDLATNNTPAIDEAGRSVPLPEKTAEQWDADAESYAKLALQCRTAAEMRRAAAQEVGR